ncbi:MAG: PAS domain-containing protein [Archangiaceae bacterium]|nr:PAS domain-containing protein [Archangiaceae bacterium]
MFLDQLTHEQLVARLELALEGANLGVWDWDLTNDAVQFDRRWCEMLGLDHATTPQHLDTWRSRVHPDDLAGCYREVQAHLDGKTERYECLHRVRHANGEWRWILDRGRISARDATGKPTRFTGTHLDVTATEDAHRRELFENRLASLGLAAGGLAHELNSPLQAITLAAEELKAALTAPSLDVVALTRLVDIIVTTGRRAAELTNALRSVSRSGDEPPSSCSLGDVLRNVESLTKPRFSPGRTLTVKEDGPCLKVCGRASELTHVVLNLVNNACDAIGAGDGWVRLETAVDGGTVRLRCIDSGPGVSKANATRVMEPFFSTKGSDGGMGLGLPISQHLARKNRGTLVLLSGTPHTTFELTLEVAP